MTATLFAHDNSTQYFSLGGASYISFYDANTLDQLSCTMMPVRTVREVSTIANSNIIAVLTKDATEAQIWDRIGNNAYFSLQLTCEIISVRLRPDILICLCMSQIVIFNLFDKNQLCAISTAPNPNKVFDMEESYASANILVQGKEPGWLAFYNWLTTEMYSEIQAYARKPVKMARFSRDGKFVVVVSDMSEKVKIFAVHNKMLMAVLMLGKKEKITDVRFDAWTMQVMVTTETNTVKLFDVPVKEGKVEARMSVKPIALFTLPKNQMFWALFGAKLYEINLVSCDFVFYRLKWDVVTKMLKKEDGVMLRTGPRERRRTSTL